MPTTATDSEKASAASRLHIALVGKEKAGKSRLAATGRKNVLFLDTDGRIQSVAGMHGVYGLTFSDSPWPQQPIAISEVLDVVAGLEKSLDLSLLDPWPGKKKPFDVPPGTMIGTVVADSAATLAKCAM